MTERVLLVGYRLSPGENYVAGARLSFEMILEGLKKAGVPFDIVDLNVAGRMERGAFEPRRALRSLPLVFLFWLKVLRSGTVCLTLSSSRPGFWRNFLAIWPARFLGRRIILHMYGGGYGYFYRMQPGWMQEIIRATISRSDVIVVEGKLLQAQFDFVADVEKKIRIVPNGLPVGLRPDVLESKSWDPATPFRLLFLSNMLKSKGYLDILSACRILKERGVSNLRCDFCGQFIRHSVEDEQIGAAEAKERFLDRIRAEGLEDIAVYQGVVSGERKVELLRRSHLFLLPTAYPWEGQPLSVIEALAFGAPVIATRYRGIPEQVIHGYNGYFVEFNAPDQIADAVQAVMGDPEGYRELSRNALAHYARHFTLKAHLEGLMSVILHGRSGAGRCGERDGEG